MELFSSVKYLSLLVLFILLFYCSLLWLSILLYGAIYYSVIPAAAHIFPIYLQFPPSECFSYSPHSPEPPCIFPSANISLVKEGDYDLMKRGHTYAIEIALEMPESEKNQHLGMFMIEIDMLSKKKEVLRYSSRPAILTYKSFIFKTIYVLFYSPWLLSGSIEEKQLLIIPLFERFEEDTYHPTHFVQVKILSGTIQVYTAFLRIHAQFKGFRYFMYYWPVSSSVLGVSTIFFSICFFFFAIVFLFWRRTSELLNLPSQVRRRLKKQRIKVAERRRKQVTLGSSDVSSTVMGDESLQTNEVEDITEPRISAMTNERETSEIEKELLNITGASDDDDDEEEPWSSSVEYFPEEHEEEEEESELVKSIRQRHIKI